MQNWIGSRKKSRRRETEMLRDGQALRKLRAKSAPKLSEEIRRHLRDLGFRQSEFEAKLTQLAEPAPTGLDAVELLFSPNPGRTAETVACDRVERRNFAADARDQVRSRCT